ncbi:hypothetical protein BCR37DRAFT_254762 [Protomyces lactucae-debilis]|uniref:tRNA-splicing endonuclease subunit Sen2 n=1 Tax=Protomyces lactucae-debilis TaxID=2754530 RepID=A0A1Y2FLS5_PROLT|nr:uncharacterized protein BCR37DRAFT_254762 [Protomyces lactucae-debilis]ORY84920.1 hypothetical protein BCR37DRAFT_254762 [Protomyces lactucae-debilis]
MSKHARSHLKQLYKDPLPVVNVIPLPPITPHNPLSVLICLWHYLTYCPPQADRLIGKLDQATRSVWLLDQRSAQRAWYAGFFGKGTFSRSDPTWHIRVQRQLGILGPDERLVSEEITARRRIARQAMKTERAKVEREARERILREESGLGLLEDEKMLDEAVFQEVSAVQPYLARPVLDEPVVESIPDLEHLQLSLHEAIFLAVALDTLDIQDDDHFIDKASLLPILIQIALPNQSQVKQVPASEPFLLRYAAYHHYRAHGWTVKPGIKFGIDWILYDRGPVFSHADYSIVVVPDPIHADVQEDTRPWWWLHAVNRVNAQVKKTVILCYITFDASRPVRLDQGLKSILQRYTIREVSIKRWNAGRNR